jgi:hypothetical protein
MAISTIAFFTASTVIYRINVGDRYQDHFLLMGILLGIGFGFLSGGDLHTVVLEVMPWTIMGSLLCSIINHRTVELARCRDPLLQEKAPLLGWKCFHGEITMGRLGLDYTLFNRIPIGVLVLFSRHSGPFFYGVLGLFSPRRSTFGSQTATSA